MTTAAKHSIVYIAITFDHVLCRLNGLGPIVFEPCAGLPSITYDLWLYSCNTTFMLTIIKMTVKQ